MTIPGIPKVIPITLMQSCETIKSGNVKYHRWQVLLAPAAAITTHKSQGVTAKYGIVYAPSNKAKHFCRGLEYVAISRCPSVELLHLLHHLRESHFTSSVTRTIGIGLIFNIQKLCYL